MRQAIEEVFILDVIRHYTTYKTYYKLIKSIEDDPKVEKRKAAQALARFMSLHPHNIAQKTEVMVEHFRRCTMHLLGGRAKAMVVTSSRLHAVRYKQAFDKYIAEKGYTGIKTLVAFSGKVVDPDVARVEYIPFQDSDLEKLYSYVRFLLTKLPPGDRGPVYRFDEEVALKYYRLQKLSEGSLLLEPGTTGAVGGPTAVGTGLPHGEKIELSKLIDIVNERFGTEFKPADQLFLDSIREDAVADTNLREAALANTQENFGYVFRKALEGLFIDRMEQNEEIAARFMNDSEFQEMVGKHLLKEVYGQIRAQEEKRRAEHVLPFRRVDPREEDKFKTCVPLMTLKAAAGGFGDVQSAEIDGWVEPRTQRTLRPGMFVAQVVGESMVPRIPNGGWCLFQGPVEGSRNGRIVLVQHQDIRDTETGASYTVKRYASEKTMRADGSWEHTSVRLEPLNAAFGPIEVSAGLASELRVIAEMVEVLAA